MFGETAPDIVTMGKPMGNGHPVERGNNQRNCRSLQCLWDEYFNTVNFGSPTLMLRGKILCVLNAFQCNKE